MERSPVREPVVAGQFYTAQPEALAREVAGYMAGAKAPHAHAEGRHTLLAMAPHAGYMFSGAVAGKTLGAARLTRDILLLGPNHTGMGQSLAVWDKGAWAFPGGGLPVAEDLAARLLDCEGRLTPDTQAHLREHSLEVLLPFLAAGDAERRIVPVAVAEPRLEMLLSVAKTVADCLRAWPQPVSLVVSSDMSHYVSETEAKELDHLALERVTALDPQGLYSTVRDRGISMCGVLPMTLGLAIALELGAGEAVETAYDTSATASGDRGRVVGYAGVLVC